MDLNIDILRAPDPGPTDGSILVLQSTHRSQKVWEANLSRPDDCESLRTRRVESKRRGKNDPAAPIGSLRRRRNETSPVVMDLIRRARLEGLCNLPFISLDWGLITALVERWRPETHTFHFRFGEKTITLQDVEVLLGIPVDGLAVTGNSNVDVEDVCRCLLGEAPQGQDINGAKVSIRWLRERFTGVVPEGASAEVVAQQARGYLLLLLGGTIFADFTGRFVHCCYLPLLDDFDRAGEYSWGSAALAMLYSNLCHGAKSDSKQMTGYLVLAQIWAWERFPLLAPARKGKRAPNSNAPLMGRWDDDFSSPDLVTHVVGAYRHHFDIQKYDEVIWTPYSEELLDSLPYYCRAGSAIWRASVPLICFATVEYYQPERVLRQFGFRQGIPPPSHSTKKPHGTTLRSGQKDWALKHAPFLKLWEERHLHVVEAVSPDLPVYESDDPYLLWYERITRRCISRVGAAVDGASRCFKALMRPDVLESYQAIGMAGCDHLRVIEKFLRLEPPDHKEFQQPPQCAGEEEDLPSGYGVGSSEQSIPQEHMTSQAEDEWQGEHHACRSEPCYVPQPPEPLASSYQVDGVFPLLSHSILDYTGLTPRADGGSSSQQEDAWENFEVFGFSPCRPVNEDLLTAKRRRIGESDLGDASEPHGDGIVTQVAVEEGRVEFQSNLDETEGSQDGDQSEDAQLDGIVTQVAVEDSRVELQSNVDDEGCHDGDKNDDAQPDIESEVMDKDPGIGVTQVADIASPVFYQRKGTRNRKKTHCGTGGTHSTHVKGKTKKKVDKSV